MRTPRHIRLDRLFDDHATVARTTRTAITATDPDQAGTWQHTTDTPDAAGGLYRCVRMTAREAQALLQLALPRSARTIPGRKEHALLMIAVAQLLEELAAIDTVTVPYTAIAAGQQLAVQVRDWLVFNNHVVMERSDRASDPMTGRARTPDALNRGARTLAASTPKSVPLDPAASWHKYGSTPRNRGNLEMFSPRRATSCPTK